MFISWIILYYCDILIHYITVILLSSSGGYNCRLTTFPSRFAHDVSIMCYCHCSALIYMSLFCNKAELYNKKKKNTHVIAKSGLHRHAN